MNITLYCNDIFQAIKINQFNDVHSLIEYHFGIYKDEQIIKLNDKIITHTQLKENDLLYVTSKVKSVNPLCTIVGECHYYQFKMIIDSGAQQNTMSVSLAEKLKLSIDRTSSSVAHGIGTAKIVGVANCNIKIKQHYYDIRFQIMETNVNDPLTKFLVLIGLEFLYHYQCEISLKRKCIDIQGEAVDFIEDEYIVPIKVENPIQKQYQNLNLNLNQHVILKKIINNIIEHPYDEKFKSINKNSTTFKNNLSSCVDFMKYIGFIEHTDSLKYTNDIDTLNNLIEVM